MNMWQAVIKECSYPYRVISHKYIQNTYNYLTYVGVNSAESLSFEIIGIPENKTDEEESENSEEIRLQQEPAYEKVN